MLNIKHIAADLKSPILILRGKLMKDEAVELKKVCEQYLKEKKKLTLNLGEITFIDIYGIKALRELIRQEVKLSNCSFYIFTMVETLNGCCMNENRGSSSRKRSLGKMDSPLK